MFVCVFGEVCVIKSDMSTVDDLLGEVLDRMGQEIRGVRDTPAADVFAANVPLITRAFRITFVLSPRSESDYSYRLTVGKRVYCECVYLAATRNGAIGRTPLVPRATCAAFRPRAYTREEIKEVNTISGCNLEMSTSDLGMQSRDVDISSRDAISRCRENISGCNLEI
jgi:hypothetical protein